MFILFVILHVFSPLSSHSFIHLHCIVDTVFTINAHRLNYMYRVSSIILSLFPVCSCSLNISSLSVQFVMYFVFPSSIFRPPFRLSVFSLSKCLSIFVLLCFALFCFSLLCLFVWVFLLLLHTVTSLVNRMFERCSPCALISSEISTFLRISLIAAVKLFR